MSNTNKRIVSIDVEGCLNRGKGKPTSLRGFEQLRKYNLRAIDESYTVRAKGDYFGETFHRLVPKYSINTGRNASFVEHLCMDIGLVKDSEITRWPYHVVENGGILYNSIKGGVETTPEVSEIFVVSVLPEIKREITSRIPESVYEFGKETMASFNPPYEMPMNEFYEKCMAVLEENMGMKVVGKDGNGSGDAYITHSKDAVDICSPGVSKLSGFKHVLDKEHIPMHETAAIGDSPGDWPVLKAVDYPCCPANADEETKKLVKSRHGYVSSHSDIWGVNDILKYISEMNHAWFYQ